MDGAPGRPGYDGLPGQKGFSQKGNEFALNPTIIVSQVEIDIIREMKNRTVAMVNNLTVCHSKR